MSQNTIRRPAAIQSGPAPICDLVSPRQDSSELPVRDGSSRMEALHRLGAPMRMEKPQATKPSKLHIPPPPRTKEDSRFNTFLAFLMGLAVAVGQASMLPLQGSFLRSCIVLLACAMPSLSVSHIIVSDLRLPYLAIVPLTMLFLLSVGIIYRISTVLAKGLEIAYKELASKGRDYL